MVDVGAGPYGVLLLQTQTGTAYIAVLVGWEVVQKAVESHGRRIGLPEILFGQSFVEEQLTAFGEEGESLVVVGHGLLEASAVLAGHTAHLIGVDDERVALYSLRGVRLGAEIVLKVELGYRTQEVGLGEVGLGGDGLVEILDGHHIIVKIKGVLTDAHHLLGVDLRADFHRSQYGRNSNCREGDDYIERTGFH